MNVIPTPLPGVLLIEPQVFADSRGYFYESYQEARYRAQGVSAHFVQDNQSASTRGVLRGMHYQVERPQAKLVQVIQGEVFDVAVDIRQGSPHFGQWYGALLSSENKRQLYIPIGFAHGYYVTSETAVFQYKCSDYYHKAGERGVRWDDPGIGIVWPGHTPILAERDAAFPLLAEIGADLPRYERS